MRLQGKLYLFGLLQIVLLALSLIGVAVLSRPDREDSQRRTARGAIVERIEAATSLDEIEAVLASLQEKEAIAITILSRGRSLASTTPGVGKCERKRRHHHRRPGLPSFFFGKRPQRRCSRHVATLQINAAQPLVEVQIRTPPPPAHPPIGALGLGATLLLLLLSTALFGRSLVRSLTELRRAADAIRDGELGARAALSRKDEIGDVARAFNAMSARVEFLLRSEKELLANVSHELRTPLARLTVGLELAMANPSEMALNGIQQDVVQLTSLVERLLFNAQLEAGTQGDGLLPGLEKTKLFVKEEVAEAVRTFRRAAIDREVTVSAPDGPGPMLLADNRLLQSALSNLLENAHKYSPDNQTPIEIAIQLEECGETVSIAVSDRGIGLGGEAPDAFLLPFERGSDAKRRGIPGTGLGLSLVRHIAESHGGTITLEDTGVGATATLSLPAMTALGSHLVTDASGANET